MAMGSSSVSAVLVLLLCVATAATASPQLLSPTFYDMSCPAALDVIRSAVADVVAQERRMGASLLRLHFHDCFVNGCDASVLLNDTATFTGEQGAAPNMNSIRGFAVIDMIKQRVEAVCSQTVSCADILAVAARDSVVALGGPSWPVLLGRKDSTTANKTAAENDLPPPTFDLVNLTESFASKGLSVADLVALSGAHTIGLSQCLNFRDRLYNETTSIDGGFAASLQAGCPRANGTGDSNLAPLDTTTPMEFDNAYYRNLLSQKGLLHSDQVLFNGSAATDNTVRSFASCAATFGSAFGTAMINMGNIAPLTGAEGEIRLTCSRVN